MSKVNDPENRPVVDRTFTEQVYLTEQKVVQLVRSRAVKLVQIFRIDI